MTTGLPESTGPTDFPARFIERFGTLSTGDAAMLKRDAGKTLAEAKRGMMVFYRLYGTPEYDRDEEIFFLVSTLYALNQHPPPGDFGKTMAALRGRKLSDDSADRRMCILLDCHFDLIDGRKPGGGALAHRLRQLVRLADSDGVGVDWPQLLRDLCRWERPEKWIQKKWARSYFGKPTELPGDASAAAAEGE